MAEHRDGCDCPFCRSKAWKAAREAAEAGRAHEQADRDAVRAAVTAAGGPGAVLALAGRRGGTGRALALLGEAGFDVARATRSDPWAGSPDHDQRVEQALLHGLPDAELAKIRAEVAAEYAGKALEKQARQQSGVLWRTRGGELVTDGRAPALGVSMDERGPVQQSVTHNDVAELGT